MLGFSPTGTAPISDIGSGVFVILYYTSAPSEISAGLGAATTAPSNISASIVSDTNAPSDISGIAAGNNIISVEIAQHTFLILSDSNSAIEWLTTARADDAIPAWLRFIILPAWLARGAVVFVTADANAIAVLTPRNALRIVSDANAILVPLEPSA